MTDFPVGTKVVIQGLVASKEHNGKVGVVSKAAAPGGRIAIKLHGGKLLSVKPTNLERAPSSGGSGASPQSDSSPKVKERTLKRDNALLREFNGSPDPNVLALYYHFRDREFDCFNAQEYNIQMIRYYDNAMKVVLVVPRQIQDNDYVLVCLQHAEHEKNTLCEVAFNCGRSFAGICMLVKDRCFACNRPKAKKCACSCAFFCSDACRETSDIGKEHGQLCRRIDHGAVTVETESLQLIE